MSLERLHPTKNVMNIFSSLRAIMLVHEKNSFPIKTDWTLRHVRPTVIYNWRVIRRRRSPAIFMMLTMTDKCTVSCMYQTFLCL